MQHQDVIDHLPGLRRYARALTGDAWAADDLVQDTLERACSKWRLWIAGTDLRAWLFSVMHNLFANQTRYTLRHAPLAVIDIDDVAPELAAPGCDTSGMLDLQRCLLQLPLPQRTVLLLVCLEDMSYEDVARVTGTPVGTVMSRLSRARSRLRELMHADAPCAVSENAVLRSGGSPTLRRLK